MSNADRIRVAVQGLRLQRSAQMGPAYFHGETMRPFLAEGDLIVAESVTWEDIRHGDIITYRFEDNFPTRRVIRIDRAGGTLILRGDSIPGYPDYTIGREDVLGRAAARVRGGVRVDRHHRQWRRATRRALMIHRLISVARALGWPGGGLLFRIVTRFRPG